VLVELVVQDLGVIADLRLLLGPGMTALTGETGAGKTMLVEALELLVGGKADSALVRPGADEATIEGRFVLDDEEIVLARVVPAVGRSRAYVNGRLDYDYETGNWLTDGIRFKYQMDGKDVEDVVTGSIKWIEDPDRQTNGKGHYEFNLRFNEDKNKPAATEAAAFDKMKDEDAFFAVDNSVPSMTGKVEYVDTFSGGTTTPISSKITYHLSANKLTKQQIVNFYKLWMLVVGPTNDE